MSKPTVLYRGQASVVGGVAFLVPIDHPNHMEGHEVSNIKVVRTSRVLEHDPQTGRIETKHTVYMPEEAGEVA